MSIAQQFLQEFEQEMNCMRKFLENVPEDKYGWKPHDKSMSAGQLSWHIASCIEGIANMALADEVGLPDMERPDAPSKAKVLEELDKGIAAVNENLPKLADERMSETWQVKDGDQVVFELPRAAMIRMLLLSHLIHHRGQLGVYLRMLGAKVPSVYGPSGDEMPEFLSDATAGMN